MNPNTKLIEINGTKLEVDLRVATRVETLKVGTRVKTLNKKYGDTYEVRHGIVIGFEPFKELPTIIIAVATLDYNQAKIEFLYYNSKSQDVDIVVALDDDLAALDKQVFCDFIDREIVKKQTEIAELESRRAYFLDKFASYWQPIEQAVADATA